MQGTALGLAVLNRSCPRFALNDAEAGMRPRSRLVSERQDLQPRLDVLDCRQVLMWRIDFSAPQCASPSAMGANTQTAPPTH